MEDFETLLTGNEIFLTRTRGIGVLTAEAGHRLQHGRARCCALRACRTTCARPQPYSIYDRFEFDVCSRPEGDVWARFVVRMDEIYQSLRILKQALEQLPEGPIMPPARSSTRCACPRARRIRESKGRRASWASSSFSDGKANPYRYHVRAPTFINLTSLEKMSLGHKIADSVVILGAVDIVLGEVDR